MTTERKETASREERGLLDLLRRRLKPVRNEDGTWTLACSSEVQVVDLPPCPLPGGWDHVRNNVQSDARERSEDERRTADERTEAAFLAAVFQTLSKAGGCVYVSPTARQPQREDRTATLYVSSVPGAARQQGREDDAVSDGPSVLDEL
jgi:hypothetical protein